MISARQFKKIILDHYKAVGRDFAWRHTRDPYRILVSEIMLQQTQVSRVEKFYATFIRQFPDFRSLAKAKTADVLRVWQGLGYNRRALMLQRLGRVVVKKYHGRLPRDRETLESLPGIGSYTAGAIRTFAFNEPEIFIETNIRRVFIHFFFPNRRKVRDEEIRILIRKTLPKKNIESVDSRSRVGARDRLRGNDRKKSGIRIWYWALMDYGAMLGANAAKNPNRRSAHYAKQSMFSGSDRELRGKILRLLLARKKIPQSRLFETMPQPKVRIKRIVNDLEREGFILKKKSLIKTV